MFGTEEQTSVLTVLACNNNHSARLRYEMLHERLHRRQIGQTVTVLVGRDLVVHAAGDDGESCPVTIHVCDVSRGQAKIGIDAPLSCHVDREELYLKRRKRVS